MFSPLCNDGLPGFLDEIHNASLRILEKTGIHFDHEQTLELFAGHGFEVRGQVVRFSEERLMELVARAPASFTLYGRNPEIEVKLGTGITHPAPAYGPSLICQSDGQSREASIDDYCRLIKLHQACHHFNINCCLVVQPSGISLEALFFEAMRLSDKVLIAPGDGDAAANCMAMLEIVFGGKSELQKRPRALTIVNPNSPLQYDANQLETLWQFAKYGQVPVITAGAIPGVSAPIFAPAALAQSNAEALAGVALCQLVNPGAPVVYGSTFPVMDLRNAFTTTANPEFSRNCFYAKQLAMRYGLPVRAGGAGSDAEVVGAQSGYESMMNLMATFGSGVDLAIHSGGIMQGLKSLSYEKLICDFELLGMAAKLHSPIDTANLDQGLEAIERLGHGGSHLTEPATALNCRTEYFLAELGLHGASQGGVEKLFEQRIQDKLDSLLDSYQKPALPQKVQEEIRSFLNKTGKAPG